jgi:hypothetical protein
VNFNSLSLLKVVEFTLTITEAIFSFIVISALEEKGKTSVYQASFLCADETSKKTENFHS